MKELQLTQVDQIVGQIKKLQSSKDQRLITNLKMLVRDFKSESPTLQSDLPKERVHLLSTLNTTIHHNCSLIEHEESLLPSVKEVWRWVKTLLQQYISLLKHASKAKE